MSPEPNPQRWRALAICLAAGFMTMLDISIVNVALPSIERSLNAGPTTLQLLVAGYSLTFGLVLIPAGRLGDRYGRRAMFILGLILFVAASAVAGIAPDETVLGVARLAQGAGAGLLNPQVIGLIQELFPGRERAKALGLFGATIGISTALGPLLGGILIEVGGAEHGWRWVFLINVPIILIVLPAALWLLPKRAPGEEGARLDMDRFGLLLVGIVTLTVMLPFVMTTGGDDSPARWLWLVLAVVALAILIWWERRYERSGRPGVLDFELLKTGSFRWGAILGIAYFAGFTSIFLVVTLFLQQALQFSALEAGIAAMPFAVCSAITSALSSRFMANGRWLVVLGIGIMLIGLIATIAVIHLVPGVGAGWASAATLGLCGLGSGLVISPNQTLTLSDVPIARAGTAAGLLQTGQRFGSAIGTALSLAIFYRYLGVSEGSLDSRYISAFTGGLLITTALVAVAFGIGVFDARRRFVVGETAA